MSTPDAESWEAASDAKIAARNAERREFAAYLEARGPVPTVKGIVLAFEQALEGLYQLGEWSSGLHEVVEFAHPTDAERALAVDILGRIREVSAILAVRTGAQLVGDGDSRIARTMAEFVDRVTERAELENTLTNAEVDRWGYGTD